MKRIYPKCICIVILLALFGTTACKSPLGKYTSPKGYDLTKPDKFNMPSSLLEISGIAFHDSNSDTIYSIQDEEGKLFRQKWDVKEQKNMKFGSRGDYEDVSIFHDMVFVLKSNGALYSFPFSETIKNKSDQVKERKHLVPKAEYESLYADAATSKLYILCKNCPDDKKAKIATGYILDYQPDVDTLVASGSFKIDLKQLKAVYPKFKNDLRASAMAKNPKTNEWYIVSSVSKLLVITDDKWNVKEAHHLSSSIFNQPEGIAFDKNLNLYISNEGDELTDGNIIKFKYAP